MATLNDSTTQTFVSAHQKLRFYLLAAASQLNCQIKNFLQPYDITAKQLDILQILSERPNTPHGIMQIRNCMSDQMSDTSRLIDRLLKKKWVKKQPCKQDKRQAEVLITPSGLALLSQIHQEMEIMDQKTARLSEDEVETLIGLLNKMKGEESS
jgi:DNA-binding MarR family transcriptional regulator